MINYINTNLSNMFTAVILIFRREVTQKTKTSLGKSLRAADERKRFFFSLLPTRPSVSGCLWMPRRPERQRASCSERKMEERHPTSGSSSLSLALSPPVGIDMRD